MGLLDFPMELLLKIANNLSNFKDLNALVLTCRKFHQVLNPILYQIDARQEDSLALSWAACYQRANTALLSLIGGADPFKDFYFRARKPENWRWSKETKVRSKSRGRRGEPNTEIRIHTDSVLKQRVWERYDDSGENLRRCWGPIQLALFFGDVRMIQLFVLHGAHTLKNLPERLLHHRALHIASSGSNLYLVRLLVSSGACVNARDDEGLTPLHYATRAREPAGGKWGPDHVEVVLFLLEMGADPFNRDDEGRAPADDIPQRFGGRFGSSSGPLRRLKGPVHPEGSSSASTESRRSYRPSHPPVDRDKINRVGRKIKKLLEQAKKIRL